VLSRAIEKFDRVARLSSNDPSDSDESNDEPTTPRPLPSELRRPTSILPQPDTTALHPHGSNEPNDPTHIQYQLSMARAQVNLHDMTAAQLVTSLIQRCEENPEKLGAQLLQARATLVEHYQKIGETAKAEQALDQAAESFWAVLGLCDTKKHSILEAAISLSKLHVEAGRYDTAENMFQKVASEAEIAFSTDDYCTIDILIAIGVFYQEQDRWQDAREYFEQALSIAMVAYSLESEPTRRLEMALERKRYVVHFPTCEEFEDGLLKRWPQQREEVVRKIRFMI